MKMKTEASRNGDQPFKITTFECCGIIADAWPIFKTFAGRQNFKNATITSSEKSAETMSTRALSMKFDQKNCIAANDNPLTTSAGQTSSVSFQLTMLRTSHSGRINDSGGRIRPVIALSVISSNPVTAASTRIGLPTPPQATGAVLAIRHSVAAWNGLKPNPIKKDPAMATGAPPPPVPSKNAPKQNAINTNCNRLSDDNPAMDCFITSNWPVSTATLY